MLITIYVRTIVKVNLGKSMFLHAVFCSKNAHLVEKYL